MKRITFPGVRFNHNYDANAPPGTCRERLIVICRAGKCDFFFIFVVYKIEGENDNNRNALKTTGKGNNGKFKDN